MRNAKQWFGIILGMVMLFLLTGCAPGPTPGPTPSPTPGEMEKDFTLPTVEDESFTLGDHLGRPIVLSFFTTACLSCPHMVAPLNTAYSRYRDSQDLLVVGVGYGTMDAIAAYAVERGMEYPVVVDSERVAVDLYRVNTVPLTFFINRQGQIVDRHVGVLFEADIDDFLEMIW